MRNIVIYLTTSIDGKYQLIVYNLYYNVYIIYYNIIPLYTYAYTYILQARLRV